MAVPSSGQLRFSGIAKELKWNNKDEDDVDVDDVDEENSLAFCSGSHKSKNIYVPVHFDNTSLLTDNPNLKVLDEKALEKESSNGILIFKMSPGDAIFFHNRTLHRSMPSSNKKVRSALSLRMLGDNACLTNICCKNPQPPFDKFGMDLIKKKKK